MRTMEQLVKKVSAISLSDDLANLPNALQEARKLWR